MTSKTKPKGINPRYWASVLGLILLYALAGGSTDWKWAFTFIFPIWLGALATFVITKADKVYKPATIWPFSVYALFFLVVGLFGVLVWNDRSMLGELGILYGTFYCAAAFGTHFLKLFVPKTTKVAEE